MRLIELGSACAHFRRRRPPPARSPASGRSRDFYIDEVVTSEKTIRFRKRTRPQRAVQWNARRSNRPNSLLRHNIPPGKAMAYLGLGRSATAAARRQTDHVLRSLADFEVRPKRGVDFVTLFATHAFAITISENAVLLQLFRLIRVYESPFSDLKSYKCQLH
jgi:hypothetical protein